MAVSVKGSICFVDLNYKCFEGRACLLCVYRWVCIFIQVLVWDMQLGAAVCKAMAFCAVVAWRSVFADPQRWTVIPISTLEPFRGTTCFQPLNTTVTKQHIPVYSRCSSGKLTVKTWPHVQNPLGIGSLTSLGTKSCIAPSISWWPGPTTFHP